MQLLQKPYEFIGWLAAMPFRPFLSGRVKRDNNEALLTWPNVVSVVRVPLGILTYWLRNNPAWTLAVVALSFYTDALDGALAKEFFGKTRYGAIVDPACDKIFFVLYAFWHKREFNYYALGALAAVETVLFIIQMSALAIARHKGKRFTDKALRSTIIGKTKGFLEGAAFLLPFAHIEPPVITATLCAAIVFAIWSAAKQVRDNPDPYEVNR